MPSQHLEQIRVRATHPALYGLVDKMRRVGQKKIIWQLFFDGDVDEWKGAEAIRVVPQREEAAVVFGDVLHLFTGRFSMSDIGTPVILPKGETVYITAVIDKRKAYFKYNGTLPDFICGTISMCRYVDHYANC